MYTQHDLLNQALARDTSPKSIFFIGTVLSLIKPITNSEDCHPVLSPAGSTKECPNFGTAGKADRRHQTTNDTEI